ncbi:MAG TPA: DUF1822 family protein [Waterburya sp.]|jgi:hypothetical protein
MTYLSDSSTFTVPLSTSAHARAEQFRRQQSNPQKAKQVYLNTLAVSAVNFYLRCMGIDTDWEASDSCNPVIYSLIDIADLEVKNRGKLECIPVLSPNQIVHIPPEVWSNRIGYVAVEFDSSLQRATLLGFTETVPESGELAIAQLRSLEDLLEYLRQSEQPEPLRIQVNLSQWFENLFETDWQPLEALFGTQNLAFSFRSDSQFNEATIKRAKLLNLGVQLGSQSVAILVAITPEVEQKVSILVQAHPVAGETFLPPNIKLSLLSISGETLQDVQSRSQDNYIQLKRFRGLPGESFNIRIAFGNVTITETFVI